MKRNILIIFLFAIFLLSTSDFVFAQKKQLPNFKLKNIQGKVVSSQQFKGKVLLINFWATWCGPCKREIPDLVKLKENYSKNGFEIVSIAVSSGNLKDIGKFAKRMKINYPVLMGDQKVGRAFGGVSLLPTSFIIDRKGQIQQVLVGAKPYKVFEQKIKQLLE